MCGRYTNITPVDAFVQLFHARRLEEELQPRYNVAPGQNVLACRAVPGSREGDRELVLLHWGLIPSWADDPKTGYKMINARAETVAQKPSFCSAFQYRRCLVAADGFYEWRRVEGRRVKQPYHIRLKGGHPFGFAGLWERWSRGGGQVIESCTIIVTDANALLAPIHDRMPVILKPEHWDLWLDQEIRDAKRLAELLRPYPPEDLEVRPVGTKINSPANEGPELLEPS